MRRKRNLRSLANSFKDNFRLLFLHIFKICHVCLHFMSLSKFNQIVTFKHLLGCLRIWFVTFPSVFSDTPDKVETILQLIMKTCPRLSFAEICLCIHFTAAWKLFVMVLKCMCTRNRDIFQIWLIASLLSMCCILQTLNKICQTINL